MTQKFEGCIEFYDDSETKMFKTFIGVSNNFGVRLFQYNKLLFYYEIFIFFDRIFFLIEYFKSGCWSYIGMAFENWIPIALGPGCVKVELIEHEFLHALGVLHEQDC